MKKGEEEERERKGVEVSLYLMAFNVMSSSCKSNIHEVLSVEEVAEEGGHAGGVLIPLQAQLLIQHLDKGCLC